MNLPSLFPQYASEILPHLLNATNWLSGIQSFKYAPSYFSHNLEQKQDQIRRNTNIDGSSSYISFDDKAFSQTHISYDDIFFTACISSNYDVFSTAHISSDDGTFSNANNRCGCKLSIKLVMNGLTASTFLSSVGNSDVFKNSLKLP